jgi:hypothetical protein
MNIVDLQYPARMERGVELSRGSDNLAEPQHPLFLLSQHRPHLAGLGGT